MCFLLMIKRLIHWLVFYEVLALFHLFYSERNGWPFIGENVGQISLSFLTGHCYFCQNLNLIMNNDKHLTNSTASDVPTYSLLP